MKIIETQRLILDKWNVRRDAKALFEYAQNPNVGPNAGWAPHESIKESKLRIKKLFIPGNIRRITIKGEGVAISSILYTSVYFTDPYSSWQKWTVENTNKLIRQYIPKTMNINQLSYNKLLGIQYLLNQRPRKSLLFQSPLSLFYNFDC